MTDVRKYNISISNYKKLVKGVVILLLIMLGLILGLGLMMEFNLLDEDFPIFKCMIVIITLSIIVPIATYRFFVFKELVYCSNEGVITNSFGLIKFEDIIKIKYIINSSGDTVIFKMKNGGKIAMSTTSNFNKKANIEFKEYKMELFQFLEKTGHKDKVKTCWF